jgi:hypothetical protein
VHLWITDRVAQAQLDFERDSAPPERLQAAFVRVLQPAAPPRVVARPPAMRPAAPVHQAMAPQPAASAVQPEPEPTSAPAPAPEAAASAAQVADTAGAPEGMASAPALPASAAGDAVAAAEAASAAADAASAVPFEWPLSTQLSYKVQGNYRGPVSGTAQVRWIRQGPHYQVQVDVNLALVVTRRMTSDGELTPEGLKPRRYDEETQAIVGAARRRGVKLDEALITLNNGQTAPRPPGVQDLASQLVQLTWLFTTQPQLLQSGRTIELPVVLPWRVDTWFYDVLDADRLDTPLGRMPVVHVKPRRLQRSEAPGSILTVETWFAPTLQYLPARIRIEQDAQTWLDLLIDAAPLQAQPR